MRARANEQRADKPIVAVLCALSSACGPVYLYEEPAPSGQSATESAAGSGGASDTAAAATGGTPASPAPPDPAPSGLPAPQARLSVQASECGRCFELTAEAIGGTPPYDLTWDDGTRGPRRRVCIDAVPVRVAVVATDAFGTRSAPSETQLRVADDAARCATPTRKPHLCLMNPSFEGTPAVNLGENFDAVPWSACSDTSGNTPDVVSDSLDFMMGFAPTATEGTSYVALRSGEQVSQALCEPLVSGDIVRLKLDLTRIELAPGDTTKNFLEIYGGIAASCSARQLLWASPPLQSGWTNFCVELGIVESMDSLTLQAHTDVASIVVQYLAVDHLEPVDSCP